MLRILLSSNIIIKMQKFIYILSLLSLVLIVACENNSEEINLSSETRVSAFTFYADTANPGLAEAVFKIEHKSWPDTGRIYSVDSLRYGTCLDSVRPHVSYMIVPSAVRFVTPDSIMISTGADTLNFNQRPIYLFIQAADTAYKRCYRIDLHVHTADPDLYVWKQMTPQLFAPNAAPDYSHMKAVYRSGYIYLFVNNGFGTELYQSADGAAWRKLENPIGLPALCQVRDILPCGEVLYYMADDKLYTTTDFIHWTAIDFSERDYALVNMLVAFDGKPWCVLQERSTQALLLGVVTGEDVQTMTTVAGLSAGKLPENFPVSDFAALSFDSSSERPRAMIVGGRTMDGTAVNTRWNLELGLLNDSLTGYRIADFSIEQPSFNSLTGTSIIQYNDHLIMFGGVDNDLEWRSDILYSDDEGMNWYVPDTAHNKLPDTYSARQNQTVVVDDMQNIYVIGGQSFVGSYSDVYRGYLNNLKWAALKQ